MLDHINTQVCFHLHKNIHGLYVFLTLLSHRTIPSNLSPTKNQIDRMKSPSSQNLLRLASLAHLPLLDTTCWWKQSASPFGRPTPITELSVWQSGQAGVWRCVGGIEQLNSTLEDQKRLQMHLVTCQGLPPHTIWPVLFPLSGRRTSAGSSDGR